MRIVLDTNVLVSGLLTARGPCAQIIDLVVDGVIELSFDSRLFEEYENVLQRPSLGIDTDEANEFLNFIRTTGEPVAAIPLAETLPDLDDTAFLEVARTSGSILVTGNKRHYPPPLRCGVTVVSPREFLDLLGRKGANLL